MSDSLPTLSTNTPPRPLEPIISIMHEQELGKAVLNLALLIFVATFFQKPPMQQGPALLLIQILLSTGCVAIWNGIMLRRTYTRAASLLEQAGIALVFLALNVPLASVVPKGLIWFPVLCFGLWILPMVIAALPREAAT